MRQARRFHAWRTATAWCAAVAFSLAIVGGFTVAVDPETYFGRNRTHLFILNEDVFKGSLVREQKHDALLLGDSRTAYIRAGLIGGYTIVNAGIGGASLPEMERQLRRDHLQGVKVVVIGLGINHFYARSCGPAPDLFTARETLSHGLSWRQFGKAFDMISAVYRGSHYTHLPDGSRYVDDRTAIPPGWDGQTRFPRYYQQLQSQADYWKSAGQLAFNQDCLDTYRRIAAYVSSRGARLVPFLVPINRETFTRAGLSDDDVRAIVQRDVGRVLPDLVDLTLSDYGSPANFGPNDAVHFHPEIGADAIRSVLGARGEARL